MYNNRRRRDRGAAGTSARTTLDREEESKLN